VGERSLGIELPVDLREMYEATDGLYDGPGEWFVMWRFADLVERNLEAWKAESADRRLQLGFGDDGTGNPFCVRVDGGGGVFVWSPIEQDAVLLAADLREFWPGWLAGRITT